MYANVSSVQKHFRADYRSYSHFHNNSVLYEMIITNTEVIFSSDLYSIFANSSSLTEYKEYSKYGVVKTYFWDDVHHMLRRYSLVKMMDNGRQRCMLQLYF